MRLSAGKKIRVNGIVQGVGFRPFVYRVARELRLTGEVRNTSAGVDIRLFGAPANLEQFLLRLRNEPPPLASITELSSEDIPFEERADFVITKSEGDERKTVAITPDAAVCSDCKHELLDPQDRRFRYAFINCTNCGPRYSIIEDVPYDRPKTTMKEFEMCADCRREYETPDNRRYHAQPNCCPKCGPRLELLDARGKIIATDDHIRETAKLLREGKILAIKGIGGFHLACDARNSQAVQRLRQLKAREEKPFAVMVKNLEVAREIVDLPAYGATLLASPQAPIVIARKRKSSLAPEVSPVNDYFGVMLPYAPLHVLLFETAPDCLVMTSANLSDEPLVISNDEALSRLSGIADYFLLHNRKIRTRVDDPVALATGARPTIIRRARGYVPLGIETGVDVDGILAYGPMLKNTPALGRGTVIYPGQHIGDVNNRLALDMFDEVLDNLKKILGVNPKIAVCDLHPDYPTTRLAEESGLPLIKVQHHYAHLLSLMAEKRIYERAIGASFDGTGFGDDGAIWGGEIFTFDPRSYRREFHLEYVPLPGGDKAALEPWRMALVYLKHAGLDPLKYVQDERAGQLLQMLQSGLKIPHTSSMGRLFDAISAILGLCSRSTYEGKAPMALEGAIHPTNDFYDFNIENENIRTVKIIQEVVADVERKTPTGIISGKFHNTIVQLTLKSAKRLREREKLNRIFLSGGCFMNSYLVQETRRGLEENNFEVYTHTLLPPNDGGVSSGQILAAAFHPAS